MPPCSGSVFAKKGTICQGVKIELCADTQIKLLLHSSPIPLSLFYRAPIYKLTANHHELLGGRALKARHCRESGLDQAIIGTHVERPFGRVLAGAFKLGVRAGLLSTPVGAPFPSGIASRRPGSTLLNNTRSPGNRRGHLWIRLPCHRSNCIAAPCPLPGGTQHSRS